MIAWAGAERLALGLTDPLDIAPRARWPLEEVAGPQTQPAHDVRSRAREPHDIRPHRGARRRRLGHRARQCRRARRAQRHAVGARRRPTPSSSRNKRESRFLPGVRHRGRHRGDARSRAKPRARRRSCWWCRRRRCARSSQALARGDRAGHAAHRLRQGHRARHPQVHDRGDRRMRAERDAGDPVRAELCRRRGARPADRGDARGARRDAGGGAGAGRSARARFRPYHSTDVRGVEIGGAAKNVLAIAAGIVTGRGLGASAVGGADHARLCRAGALRPRARRQDRDADGPVRPGRSDPDLLEPAVAQLLASASSSARASAAKDIHGTTGLAEGAFTAPVLLEMARERKRRHADRGGGRRRAGGDR